MLHGIMYWYEGKNENRLTIAELLFEDGMGLAIMDWQKAVILTLDPKPAVALMHLTFLPVTSIPH